MVRLSGNGWRKEAGHGWWDPLLESEVMEELHEFRRRDKDGGFQGGGVYDTLPIQSTLELDGAKESSWECKVVGKGFRE